MAEDEEIQEVDVVQEEADHYRTFSATGVVGGVQVKGNVQMDFVLDRNVPSHTETYSIGEGGLDELIETQGSPYISREKQVGVSMSQSNAYQAATWLIADLLGEGVAAEDVTDALEEQFPKSFE